MTLTEALMCLAVMILLLLLSCICSYRAYIQRKKLTRNSLKRTAKEAIKDKKPYPWIYCPAFLMVIPIAIFGLFLGNYGEMFLAFGVLLAWCTFYLFVWGIWKIHDMFMFEKPKEPVTRLQTYFYTRKKVFSLYNIFVKRHSQLFCEIYQVIDENGQTYFVKGELDSPFGIGEYDIFVSIGQQTGRLYFEKIKKEYPPINQ